MEAKDPKSAEISTGVGRETVSREPGTDATSSETLDELEKEEKVTGAQGENESGGGGGATPSPDGAFDDKRGDGGVGPM